MLLMIEERSRITDSLDRIPLKNYERENRSLCFAHRESKIQNLLRTCKIVPIEEHLPMDRTL
jgi:hypothetical protein